MTQNQVDHIITQIIVSGTITFAWGIFVYGARTLPRKGFYLLIHLVATPLRFVTTLVFKILWFLIFTPIKYLILKIRQKIRNRKYDQNLFYTMEQIDQKDLVKGKKGMVRSGKWLEAYVAHLYRALGHEAYTTTELREMGQLDQYISKKGGSGEQGVDVIVKFKGEHQGKVLLLQCKHYTNNVGNDAVQEIATAKALYRGDIVAVITNQNFTKSAIELAEANGVLLINRNRFENIIKTACEAKKQVA